MVHSSTDERMPLVCGRTRQESNNNDIKIIITTANMTAGFLCLGLSYLYLPSR